SLFLTGTINNNIHIYILQTQICCSVAVVVDDQQQSLWLHMLLCHRHLSIKSTLSRRARSKESKRNRKARHVTESITTSSCNRYLCLKVQNNTRQISRDSLTAF